MRRVEWVNSQGKRKVSLIRDTDPDEAAPQGIPVETLNLSALDWEQIEVDLHNGLVSLGVYDWESARRQNELVAGAILNAVRRPLLVHLRDLSVTQPED